MEDNFVEFHNVTKKWGDFVGLDGINLKIRRGEILTLLGPSGCGKSTLMRIAAGFELPTTGDVIIDGRQMADTPPEKREVNMLFQRYALFPHLDVFDNIAFPLRIQKRPKEEIRQRVEKMLELVQLKEFSSRWINEISGGQAQRVALARALIGQPKVLLLDEPLSALDLKIRHHMLEELKRIHRETGTTFLYVTHDQDEAMILSDRIVLMNAGQIVQMGTPDEMYGKPQSLFAAKFFGETNIVEGKLVRSADRCAVETTDGLITVEDKMISEGSRVYASIRPEAFVISNHAEGNIRGIVEDIENIGARTVCRVRSGSGHAYRAQVFRTSAISTPPIGANVALSCAPADVVLVSQ
ncbi:MAG: spermidine/putrescine ABC transporter ATP-binding protein [Rhizobiales bacterium]|nr:spermidine/putrescine ABC transporter ATP-binding protein [Hyphomicrobiales bacterium]MBA70690.1 spermidine/putrescine ABC transporter ATP-binding protein [Hyphomicrobiales bacterium]|tara:strand:- start:2779 stop:3840 length:1062 start_codon:yes stop_codon:yes gene_type:complete